MNKAEIQNKVVEQIVQYIEQHYMEKLNLGQFAQQYGMSASTLSRAFQKYKNQSFVDCVNEIRLKNAVRMLSGTRENMNKIAADCGFPSSAILHRLFKEEYKMTPADYRKQNMGKDAVYSAPDHTEVIPVRSLNKTIVVSADISKGIPYEKNWNKVINISDFVCLIRAGDQEQILFLKKNLGFQYVRIWTVFSKKMAAPDGKTLGNYGYSVINLVFDFLVSNGIRPYLDFGKRIRRIKKSGGQTVFLEDDGIAFQTRQEWEQFFEKFILYLKERYGKKEVEKWIFELSYDRMNKDGDYYECDFDFIDAYSYAYRVIKREIPNAKVGGTSAIIDADREFLEEFLGVCKNRGCLPDFLSFMLFPYKSSGQGTHIRITDPGFAVEMIERMRTLFQKFRLREEGCELYISEWSSSLSVRNYVNDSCFRSAFVVHGIASIWDSVDLIAFWLGTDWVANYYDTVGILNGGGGLLTKESIRKPVYFAFEFLNQMGSRLITKEENYIITKNNDKDIFVLLYHMCWYNQKYYTRDEDHLLPDETEMLFEQEGSLCVSVCLERRPRGGLMR